MWSLRLISLIFVSLLSIILNSVSFAGSRAGAATLTIGAGYDFFSAKRHIKNTGMPFVAVGYDLTDRWSVEGLLSFFSTNSKRPEDTGRQIKSTIFAFDGAYHFSPYYKFEPYLLAGVGVIGMHPNGNDADNQGNINAGAGAQIFIDKSIAFQLEARDFYTITTNYHDVFLNAGVSFLFDLC